MFWITAYGLALSAIAILKFNFKPFDVMLALLGFLFMWWGFGL